MTRRHVTWSCEKCRKHFASCEEARSCEADHYLDASLARIKEKIANAFSDRKPVPATRRPA